MPDREQLLRWALDNPQPPTTFDIDVFKKQAATAAPEPPDSAQQDRSQ